MAMVAREDGQDEEGEQESSGRTRAAGSFRVRASMTSAQHLRSTDCCCCGRQCHRNVLIGSEA